MEEKRLKNLRKIRVPLAAAVLLCFVSAGASLGAERLLCGWKTSAVETKLREIDRLVSEKYIGETDSGSVADYAAVGYVTGLGDKWSSYIPADQYEAYRMSSEGTGCGIGVSVTSTADTVRISIVYDDSPAAQAGIVKGDYILGAEGLTVEKDGANAVISAIRGEEGTKAELTVVRDGKEIPFTCERRAVKTLSVTYHVFGGSGNVGVIRLTGFNSTTPEQFKNAVSKLKDDGCDRFVFDLRNNGGGELNSILEVLDYLLPEGPIAHIYYRTGKESHYTSDAACLEARVAVLTNGRTASAAELFTSALRDYTRHGDYDAVLVGTKTYGKGVLQSFYKLKDGSAFKISTGKYNPPYSENYDGVGITPDITVELPAELQNISLFLVEPDEDTQLWAAVDALGSR